MIQSAALLKDLKGQLKLAQADLRARADDAADHWGARLREEYAEARKRERTGHSWVVWRDNEVDQAAVAWLIAMTFVRFCEDNDLLTGARINGVTVPVGWIAGPGDRTARAEENLTAYFRENPTHNRRDWLRQAFTVLAAQPAGKALVDEAHNPVWTADISAERAAALIDFWRATDASGELVHDFTDQALDTRFLGDLYQDLSDHARKTYALLQTPVFVEEFILDQTLTPALAEFGLEGIKLIDPTCGSGHFLLGAFQRLVDQWQAEAPALDAKERVRRAMDSIHGVDLNPFAVAIARFRLTVAGLLAMGERSLVGVPNLGFHLAIGDSLLGEFGGAPEALQFEGEEAETYFYDGEDLKEYAGILKSAQYHVVVGNPPYITVKDKALNAAYRQSYPTAMRKYALSAPFAELLFRLAIPGEQGAPAGYVGQITANSFMKREFGKKLIEWFLAGFDASNRVDLTAIVDTSGAYIPGHGTPTVILVGRRRWATNDNVRVVVGLRGEPGKPMDPASGLVWSEIAEHHNEVGYEGSFVAVSSVDRATFAKHPWSLGGAGAADVKEAMESCSTSTLKSVIAEAGFSDITGNDEVFLMSSEFAESRGFSNLARPFVEGELVRNWSFSSRQMTLLAVDPAGADMELTEGALKYLWPQREVLRTSVFFGKTPAQRGLRWYDHAIFQPGKHSNDLLLTFAFVATHNHFALEREGHVFNKTAPVIKLSPGAVEDDHFGLLGLMNSSAACFWLRSMCLGKPLQGEEWQRRYEFDSTKVGRFPLVAPLPVAFGRRLDELARRRAEVAPSRVVADLVAENVTGLKVQLERARTEFESILRELIFAQEELDWATYGLYDLVDEDLNYGHTDVSTLSLGERAFEIALARKVRDGEEQTAWFTRHGAEPTADLPERWPDSYRELVLRRLEFIQSHPNVQILERPEFKRRWMVENWNELAATALQSAILFRLERPELWRDAHGPVCRSVAELADSVRDDLVLAELAEALTQDSEPDLTKLLSSLVAEERVPYLAAHRYKLPGIEKFRTWQAVWALQRAEDAGGEVEIPSPPRYSATDFARPEYWKARGKLDVPKERFILYPGFGREGDTTAVLGWAGWDHKDQALALAREFPIQDARGATDQLLKQMVAGLVELEPWVHQWHSEMDASFGVSPAQAITGVIDQQLGRLEATRDEVTAWTPPVATRGRRPKNS